MGQSYAKKRRSAYRRDSAKKDNYGAKLFHEVKKFDGDGNLIETISPDDLMARSIGATRTYHTWRKKRTHNARLAKTNGEGSIRAWGSLSTKVKKGAKVDYKKEIV